MTKLIDRRQIALYLGKPEHEQLKAISARTRISQQELLREGIHAMLQKYACLCEGDGGESDGSPHCPRHDSHNDARASTDDVLGMEWWNGLSEAERAVWLDIAWKRNAHAAGRISYKLEDMPSAADAWVAFKAASEVQS
jgi:hypothetical protein